MDPTVSVRSLSVTYRRRLRAPAVRALHELDLQAEAGEVVGVLGPNGSGKTTALEVLAGSLAPTSGNVAVLGLPPSDRRLVARVGYQPEGPLPFPALSGRELLTYLGDLMGLRRPALHTRVDTLLGELGLAQAAPRASGTYSTGMKRRLALAAALLGEPAVLLLDEPTAGIDPAGSLRVLEIVRAHAAAGGTVLMASHHLQEVEQVCDRVYVLEGGVCRAAGRLDDLLATGDQTVVVRGLGEDGLRALRRTVEDAGGEVVRVAPERRHLFALFRGLAEHGDGA